MSIHTYSFDGKVVMASWDVGLQKFALIVEEEAGEFETLVDEKYDTIYELASGLAQYGLAFPKNFLFDLCRAKSTNDSKFSELYEVSPAEERAAVAIHENWKAKQFLENYGRASGQGRRQ